MASGTTTTAPSTATTAPCTAGQTAGQSSTEPLVPIVVQIEAQDTPSVIQGARPIISAVQTMQPAQVYGTLKYYSGPPYTAPLPSTAPLPYSAYTAPCRLFMLPCLLCQLGLLYQWVIMVRAISSLLCLTLIGCFLKGSRCYNSSSFRKCSNLKLGELAKPPSHSLSPPLVWRGQYRLEAMLRLLKKVQPVLVLSGLDQSTRSVLKLDVPGLLQHLTVPPLPRGTTVGGLA